MKPATRSTTPYEIQAGVVHEAEVFSFFNDKYLEDYKKMLENHLSSTQGKTIVVNLQDMTYLEVENFDTTHKGIVIKKAEGLI